MVELLARTADPALLFNLADAKGQLKVLSTDQDDQIDLLRAAVSAQLEDDIGRAILPQTWVYRFRATQIKQGCVILPIAGGTAITAVKYYDTDNVLQTATLADFIVYSNEYGESWVEPIEGAIWPSAFSRPDSYELTITAGYADAASVPANIIHAGKLLLTELFTQRGMLHRESYKPSETYYNLLAPYKVQIAA